MQKKQIYIVFSPVGTGKISRFLHKDFKHCFVVIKTNNTWVFIDPLTKGLKISSLQAFSHNRMLKRLTSLGCKVCDIDFSCSFKKHFYLFLATFGCVSIAKQLLNIGGVFTFTPKQLYKWLYNNNYIRAEWLKS